MEPALVELTRTVPDLLSRRLAESSDLSRRLASTLLVEFEVLLTEESSVMETVDSLVAGDPSFAAAVIMSSVFGPPCTTINTTGTPFTVA